MPFSVVSLPIRPRSVAYLDALQLKVDAPRWLLTKMQQEVEVFLTSVLATTFAENL